MVKVLSLALCIIFPLGAVAEPSGFQLGPANPLEFNQSLRDHSIEAALKKIRSILSEGKTWRRGSLDWSQDPLRSLFDQSLNQLKGRDLTGLLRWWSDEGSVWVELLQKTLFEDPQLKTAVVTMGCASKLWAQLNLEMGRLAPSSTPAAQWAELGKSLAHSELLRVPSDRLWVEEARARATGLSEAQIAQGSALFQKNPELPLAAVRKSLRWPVSPALRELESAWAGFTESMQEYLLHRNLGRLRVAFEAERRRRGANPKSVEELVTAGLLTEGPRHPKTGKPLQLSDLK